MASRSTERLSRLAVYCSNSFTESLYDAVVFGLTPRSSARYRRKKPESKLASVGQFMSNRLPGSGSRSGPEAAGGFRPCDLKSTGDSVGSWPDPHAQGT